jgi:hypothetical protein
MENKSLIEQQRELLLKLREAVNSQEEFDWVEAELAHLESPGAAEGFRAKEINTVADAIDFLETGYGCVVVQVEIVPPLWKIVSREGDFEAIFTASELMAFALDERDVRAAMAARGLWRPAARFGGSNARGTP